MPLELKKARRSVAYIKIGISAPSGGGKTYSALRLGKGLMEGKHPTLSDQEHWDKIAIIDTENGSGNLYADTNINGVKIGLYNVVVLEPPFEADKYIQAIDLCQENGIEVCIIDSSTHLWSGEGGLLEQQSHVAKRTGNSYTAWRDITPMHNRFVEKMLQSPMHIIATMRAKEEYVQEKDEKSGKSRVQKLGLEPEQRKGMQFEFTMFFEIDAEHTAFGSKDRTSLFDQKYFTITQDTGKEITRWLESGSSEPAKVVAVYEKANPKEALENLKSDIISMCKGLGGSSNTVLMDKVKEYAPNGNPNSLNDVEKLTALKQDLEMLQIKEELMQPA